MSYSSVTPIGMLGILLFSGTVSAAPILTEIHYNGIASGTDPDEFVELSNSGTLTLDLSGWQFSQGINFVFESGTTLAPATSLVIARAPTDFMSVFPDYDGDLFDFAGALSNGGETLSLSDAAGLEQWSVSYDDGAPWPTDADGLGSSLQLIFGAANLSLASNWEASIPSPGIWGPDLLEPASVPAPGGILLLATGGLLLATRNRKIVTKLPSCLS